jgi:hypothetical protein
MGVRSVAMGKHYLATRKPHRLKRIREKLERARQQGLPLHRVAFGYMGIDWNMQQLSERLDHMGYRKLCNFEMQLELVMATYEDAKAAAIAGIAHLAGIANIAPDRVAEMAEQIEPPTAPFLAHASYPAHDDEQPFAFAAKPSLAFCFKNVWNRLQRLTLLELQLLYEQLKGVAAIALRHQTH